MKYCYLHLLNLLGILVLSFPLNIANAQDLDRARTVIDTLCSPAMNGRGYSFNGSNIAGEYLTAQFKKIGLASFEQGYGQSFSLKAVTFEGKVDLSVDGTALKVGRDFIAHAASRSGKGRLSVFYAGTELMKNPIAFERELPEKLHKFALVYAQKDEALLSKLPKYLVARLFQIPLHIQTAPKLTHGIRGQQYPIPIVIIQDSLIDETAQKVSFTIEARLGEHQAKNIIGYVKGTSKPDSFFVFTAHYDHLGNMGKEAYFPGANDNASGVALLLELAHYFKENPQPYSIAFMAFSGEEAGLIGSKHYVDQPFFPLDHISFLLNIDLMATGEEGTTVVNATEFPQAFAYLQQLNGEKNYLSAVKSRGPAANSDHYFFYKAGVPSFFLYLMGDWPHYHDVQDQAPVPLTEFEDTFYLLKDFVEGLGRSER